MEIRYRILLVALIVMGGMNNKGYAQTEALVEHSKPGNAMNMKLYDNPAQMYCRYMHTLNNLSIGTNYSDESKARLDEMGNGMLNGAVRVDAFIRKTPKTTIWGRAEYTNGQQRNIVYSESSDLDIVYPYLMTDSVGGDIHRETYDFTGGFAYRTGKWTIGAVGEYRALLASRTADPRPKNLTGDLKASFGATYDLGNWHTGLALNAHKYKQTNEVKIYSEITSPTIYHATGLGHDYFRFRGDYSNTYYNGHGLGGLLTLSNDRCPKDNIYSVALGFDYQKVEKIITSLNELPLAESKDYCQTAEIAKSLNDATGWGIALSEQYHCRQGYENIFGDAVANEYPMISQTPGFRQTDITFGIRGFGQWSIGGNSQAGFNASVSYTCMKQKYQQLDMMKNSLLSLNVAPQLNVFDANKSIAGILIGAIAAYDIAFDNCWQNEAEATELPLGKATHDRYDYLSNNRLRVGANAKLMVKANSKATLYMAVVGTLSRYAENENAKDLSLSIGLNF